MRHSPSLLSLLLRKRAMREWMTSQRRRRWWDGVRRSAWCSRMRRCFIQTSHSKINLFRIRIFYHSEMSAFAATQCLEVHQRFLYENDDNNNNYLRSRRRGLAGRQERSMTNALHWIRLHKNEDEDPNHHRNRVSSFNPYLPSLFSAHCFRFRILFLVSIFAEIHVRFCKDVPEERNSKNITTLFLSDPASSFMPWFATNRIKNFMFSIG